MNEEQTAHRQHPVPQNIMSVEFKLVGDLTVRQFMYLIIGGITVYLALISKISFLWKAVLIVFGGLGSLALAFVPLGDRGLDQWIKNFIKSISTPTQRVWQKALESREYFLADYADSLRKEVVALAPAKSRKAITDYLGGFPAPAGTFMDKREEDFLKKINFDVIVPPTLKSSVSTVTAPAKTAVSLEEPPKEEKPAKKEQFKEDILVVRKKEDLKNISTVTNVSVGRTLKHIPLEGEIILPKRTRPLRTITYVEPSSPVSDNQHRQELLRKAQELRKVLKKAEEKFSPEGAVLPASELILGDKEESRAKEKELTEIVNTLRKENKKLSTEMESLKAQMQGLDKTKETYKTQLSSYAERIKELEKKKVLVEETIQIKEPSKTEENPPNENEEIVRNLSRSVVKERKEIPSEKAQKENKEDAHPNIIWGMVKDKEGFLLENATLIIRDDNDSPIRALKTNKLGQFISATPLPNGTYKIEVLNSENYFDIINVVLTGKPLKALDFSAVRK